MNVTRLLAAALLPTLILPPQALLGQQKVSGAQLDGYSQSASDTERSWEEKFRAQPKPDNIRENMRRLSARPHHVGSPYDKDNAEWMLAQFKSWGFDAQIENFYVLFPTPKERLIELISPTKFTASLKEPAVPEDPTSNQFRRAAAHLQRLLRRRRREAPDHARGIGRELREAPAVVRAGVAVVVQQRRNQHPRPGDRGGVGMGYEDFLKTRIFDPLGMVDTTFYPSDRDDGALAMTYAKDGDVLQPVASSKVAPKAGDRPPSPAGGLYSTAPDLGPDLPDDARSREPRRATHPDREVRRRDGPGSRPGNSRAGSSTGWASAWPGGS